jgi:peptidoglycan/LPS O-acetylase OafA/YrhL
MRILDKWRRLPSPDPTFHTLDILRGLAALWIALFHSMPDYAYTLGASSTGDFLFGMIMNSRGVDMFFVISGYCIASSGFRHSNSPLGFLKQRVRRIYPTYWMSIVFGAIVVSLITLSGYGNTASFPSLPGILVSLPLLFANQIEFNGAYWSLVHEVHFYFVAFLALAVFRRHFIFALDIVLIVWITLAFLRINVDTAPSWSPILLTQSTFFTFYCGCLVFRVIRDINRPLVLYHLMMLGVCFSSMPHNPFVVSLTLFLFALRVFDGKILSTRGLIPLYFLGQISYSLYVTHIQVGPRIMGFLSRMIPLDNSSVWMLLIFVAMPTTIGVAYLFYLYFERPFVSRFALQKDSGRRAVAAGDPPCQR